MPAGNPKNIAGARVLVLLASRFAHLLCFTRFFAKCYFTSDGFRIAEADLAIRGPGEMFGTRQSGVPEFRAANPVLDVDLLGWARDDAFRFVQKNPGLTGVPALADLVYRRYQSGAALETVG